MTRLVADRYLLGDAIGAGGTSRVHAALDERLGRKVAIKLLDAARVASADPAGRERFLREGPTTASFSHRNAVTVFDCGEDAGDLYIVMELVDGPSLAARLASEGRLAVDDATSITRQVLAALAAAHDVGIVHRDVKPANVLIGADGDVKLADFGIAKRFDDLDDSVTSAGMVIGTPRYLAPEQATGAPVTTATDIYATGILLFEMLAGHPPAPSAPDIRTLRPEVTEHLAATVACALATTPADRFPSARDMLAALDDDSAMATQLMATSAPQEPDPRAGDTMIMPSPVAANTVAANTVASSKVATTKAATRKVATTKVVESKVVDQRPARVAKAGADTTSRNRGLVSMAAVLVAVVGVIVFLASSGDNNRVITPPGVLNATAPAGEATVSAGDVAAAPTAPPDDEPAPVEIIPGFPETTDIAVFLAQLEADPNLVGEKGEDLVEKLREMLGQNSPKKQRDKARELQSDMDEWVEEEELNAAIAAALSFLLEPFTE